MNKPNTAHAEEMSGGDILLDERVRALAADPPHATPPELLMQPADELVEDFVGADRALKRLALTRVGDIDLWDLDAARPYTLVSDMLRSEVQYGVVVDEQGQVAGLLSVEIIHDLLEAEAEAA